MDVTVPDLGDFADVEVIDVLVKPGDTVAVEAALITLETDKATMDVPSPAAGRISAVKVQRGSKVSKGDLIAVLEATEQAVEKPAPPATSGAAPAQAEAAAIAPAAAPAAAVAPRGPETVKVPDLGDFHDVDVIARRRACARAQGCQGRQGQSGRCRCADPPGHCGACE